MTITVGRLAPGDQWDQTMLDDLFANRLYPTGLEFRRVEGYPPHVDGCILLIPGQYWHKQTDQITEAVQRFSWCLGIRTGDEESLFDCSNVLHPNLKWWSQTPRGDMDARLIGLGYTPHFRQLKWACPDKSTGVFLSGQNTHGRRKECFQALENYSGDKVVRPTEGFTEGFEPAEYVSGVVNAKVCPAPSGAVSPDTFRLYEALEAHCVPIADDVSPAYDSAGYWRRLFPDCPFPLIENYSDLPGYIDDQLKGWPANANRIAAWWMRQKRLYAQWLKEDLAALGAQ